MQLFTKQVAKPATTQVDFPYLDPKALYFDSACQTLRPQVVINAEVEYYTQFNACGGRVKYYWGERVDSLVTETRQKILNFLGVSAKQYAVVFTQNTTYGINLVLSQLPAGRFWQLVTSEIEHNSVFLPTITHSRRLGLVRQVLPRAEDGSLLYTPQDFDHSVVVINTTSNIDGRRLENLKDVAQAVHEREGIIFLDAAQSLAHDAPLLQGVDFDGLFASSHKLYGPSLGFFVIKKDLLKSMEFTFLGGGTVDSVQKDSFSLINGEEEPWTPLEPGLQNYAGIIGLRAALEWLSTQGNKQAQLDELGVQLYQGLSRHPSVHLMSNRPSPIVSLYCDKVDSHRLAIFLSEQNIMTRSGYFCCHYYLEQVKRVPPLLRFSLGLHNTAEQVQQAIATFNTIVTNV